MLQSRQKFFFYVILLFSIKWICIIFFNQDIDLITNLIFNLEDRQYFTTIYNLSKLNFSPLYDPEIINSKIIALPIYSIIFHSLFFKIFNIYGFVFIELFIIYIFFYSLDHFLRNFNLNFIESLIIILTIFCITSIIDVLQLSNIQYISAIKELYNLRIPRPSVSHLYLFFFLNIMSFISVKKKFTDKNLIIIGLIFALMWGSYYYNLVITGTTFLFFYLYINKKDFLKNFKLIKNFLLILVVFIFFSIPTISIVFFSEPDYLIRVGLIDLDFNKKQILILHFLRNFLSLKFIIIFILVTGFYLYLLKNLKIKTAVINLLFFFYLGSIFGPILFILISPTFSEGYHFMNMTIGITFFTILLYSFLIFKFLFSKKKFYNRFLKSISIFVILIYAIDNFYKYNDESLTNLKLDTSNTINEIKKINFNKNLSILTFDQDLLVNLILNDYKNLKFNLGIFTSFDDHILENKIITSLKFLNFNQNDFKEFISNKKRNWRYLNNNVGKTFYMKYQANKLTTFNNSEDFNQEELRYIQNSSPLNSQQLIIPEFEISRLVQKFEDYDMSNFNKPNLIVLNVNDPLISKIYIKDEFYCVKNIGITFKMFLDVSLFKQYC